MSIDALTVSRRSSESNRTEARKASDISSDRFRQNLWQLLTQALKASDRGFDSYLQKLPKALKAFDKRLDSFRQKLWRLPVDGLTASDSYRHKFWRFPTEVLMASERSYDGFQKKFWEKLLGLPTETASDILWQLTNALLVFDSYILKNISKLAPPIQPPETPLLLCYQFTKNNV